MSAAARTLPRVSETTDTSKPGAAATTPPPTTTPAATEGGTASGTKAADTKPTNTFLQDAAPKDGAEGGAKKEEAPPAKVDAKLELKYPEGLLDAEQQKSFTALAEKLGLPGEKAQALVQHYGEIAAAAAKSAEAAFAAQQEQFRAAIESDKELGGANLEATKAAAQRALKKFASPELMELFGHGLGNHPEVARFVARVGKAMAEDTVAGTTKSTTNGELTEEQFLKRLYPSMHKES